MFTSSVGHSVANQVQSAAQKVVETVKAPLVNNLATATAKRELISYQQLKDLVLDSESPYLGHIPASFNQLVKGSQREMEAMLDWLAYRLQSPEGVKQLKPSALKAFFGKMNGSTNPVEKLLQQNKLQIKLLGSGIAGNVYQLHINGEDFAFKIFKADRSSMDVYRESATGLFFTEQETKNMSNFYVSNPIKKWTLMEFIPETARSSDRAGKTLSQQGYAISDHNAKNLVGEEGEEIRVDHGGIVTKKGEGFMSHDAFKRFSQIRKTPEQQEQKKAPSIISVERPDELAKTQQDWNSFEEMCDTMSNDSKRLLLGHGNLAQASRPVNLVRKPSEANLDPSTDTSQSLNDSHMQAAQVRFPEMQLSDDEAASQHLLGAGVTSQRRRADSEKAIRKIYDLY